MPRGCRRPLQRPRSVVPLRAVIAHCGGGGRASPGRGAFCRCGGRLSTGASPPPAARPLGGLSSPPPACCGRGCAGVGAKHCPLGLHAPWGAACRRGGRGRSPRGVAFHRCEGRLMSGAVPPPAARPLGRLAGVPRPLRTGCGLCERGDRAPAPQRAPLRAVVSRCGGGGRVSPVGALRRCEGASEARRPPSPGCPPSGRAVGLRYPPAVGAGVRIWGPSTVPLACIPCGGRVPRGWCRLSSAGLAFHRCGGRLVSGPVSQPAARPLGRGAGVLRPVCPGCGWCGRGDPAPAPQRAPLRAVVALRGGGGRVSPWGGCPAPL